MYSSRAQPESSSSEAVCLPIRLFAEALACWAWPWVVEGTMMAWAGELALVTWFWKVCEVAPSGSMSEEVLLLREEEEEIMRLDWLFSWRDVSLEDLNWCGWCASLEHLQLRQMFLC